MEIKKYINNKEVTEDIRKEIKRFLETNDNEHDDPKPMGFSKSSSKREVYSNTILPEYKKKRKNTSNRQPNSTLKIAG